MNKENQSSKLYYTIKEVANMFDLAESVLRYWEKEFTELRPRKAGRKVRQYCEKDINVIRDIHYLLKEKGMTIEGAKKQLFHQRKTVSKQVDIVKKLESIKQRLLDMKSALDNFTYEQIDMLKENIKENVNHSNES